MMRWIRLIVFMLCFSAFNLLGNSANETELTDHIIYIKYADYSMLRSLSSIPENLPVITIISALCRFTRQWKALLPRRGQRTHIVIWLTAARI